MMSLIVLQTIAALCRAPVISVQWDCQKKLVSCMQFHGNKSPSERRYYDAEEALAACVLDPRPQKQKGNP